MLREVLKRDDRGGANDNGGLQAAGRYTLITCPPVGPGNYVLARREANGAATLLYLGRSALDSASLNLARIRNLGALLGANEVHILPGDL
jgi:hypothetical protein